MEKKLKLTWDIYNDQIDIEERYCHNCGKKVNFEDSLKRRQNANGKNIFYFAIYKCPKGHTWNKKLDTFKAISGLENQDQVFECANSKYNELQLKYLKQEGIEEIEIFLRILKQGVRIDKFLSARLKDVSRRQITKMIDEGVIQVNGDHVKSKESLKEKDCIILMITD